MDMFMDKLAQKLTAQEIIKANTAADVEELNKLKNQIAEYNECLVKLQKLIDDGSRKLAEAKENDAQAGRLAKQGIDNTLALRKETESLKETLKETLGKLSEQYENMDKSLTWRADTSAKTLGNKIDRLCTQMEDQKPGQMLEKLDAVEENVHKECVKVYRNVQAVVVEETGKQAQAMTEAKEAVEAVKAKMGKILGVSIGAMVLSLMAVLFQILARLNVLPF